MEIEDVLQKIVKNKRRGDASAKHEKLLLQFQDQLAVTRARLEAAAFEDVEPVIVSDPIRSVRDAIMAGDNTALKAAALAGYEQDIYTAVRLAAEFDQDIAALVDYMITFGELASLNQRLFLESVLSAPEGSDGNVPELR